MHLVITSAAAGGLAASFSAIAAAWLRQRAKSLKAREDARRDHVRHLPPGSHLVDLGQRGIVIEVGERATREGQPDALR